MSVIPKNFAASQAVPDESSALTLAQLRAKIAENSEFDANFQHLPARKHVKLQDCKTARISISIIREQW